MEQFLTQLPTTPIGWVLLFFGGVSAAFVFMNKIRSNDLKILRESRDDLIKRDEQRGKEITELRTNITTLQEKVSSLEKRNRTLEDLVVTALKQYFLENPQLAKEMKKGLVNP